MRRTRRLALGRARGYRGWGLALAYRVTRVAGIVARVLEEIGAVRLRIHAAPADLRLPWLEEGIDRHYWRILERWRAYRHYPSYETERRLYEALEEWIAYEPCDDGDSENRPPQD